MIRMYVDAISINSQGTKLQTGLNYIFRYRTPLINVARSQRVIRILTFYFATIFRNDREERGMRMLKKTEMYLCLTRSY